MLQTIRNISAQVRDRPVCNSRRLSLVPSNYTRIFLKVKEFFVAGEATVIADGNLLFINEYSLSDADEREWRGELWLQF
jgi:hypothetical protein